MASRSEDHTQAYVNMLTTVLKRMVVLRASERADVAELLKDPWFRVGSDEEPADPATIPADPVTVPASQPHIAALLGRITVPELQELIAGLPAADQEQFTPNVSMIHRYLNQLAY